MTGIVIFRSSPVFFARGFRFVGCVRIHPTEIRNPTPLKGLGFLNAPGVGFEPTTKWLTATYSAAELPRNFRRTVSPDGWPVKVSKVQSLVREGGLGVPDVMGIAVDLDFKTIKTNTH